MVKTKVGRAAGILFFIVLYAAAAIGILYILNKGGHYLSGTDTMSHVYKGNSLYHSIKNGDWYPLYDRFWYNGAQLMRYSAPLPIYILALCQALAGGNEFSGILVFAGLAFVLGAMIWLYIGVRKRRMLLGAFLGLIWFFMPNNLYTFFVEGNLPRSCCLVLLPLFLYFLYEYLFEERWKALGCMILVFTGIVVSEVEFAVMLMISMLIFLPLYRIICKRKRRALRTLVGLMLPFLISGLWLYAAYKSRAASVYHSQMLKAFFQDAAVSLNPFYRLNVSQSAAYFGLAAFLITVFGVFCSKRKSMAGFWTALILFFFSTSMMFPVFETVPIGRYMKMLQFISIALCIILFSLFMWTTMRRWITVFCCILLLVDLLPSLSLIYTGKNDTSVSEQMKQTAQKSLIEEAKNITGQRALILDGGSTEVMNQYLLTDYNGKRIQNALGAEIGSAATVQNVSQLNEALEGGNYLYLFDRALELGTDTLLIKISRLQNQEDDLQNVTKGAEKLGFRLMKFNSEYLLYHIDIYKTFGTTCQYTGIGIGTSAPVLALSDPDIEEGDSINLNDYSFAQLSKYKLIYLAGFTYNDKEQAEKMLKKLGKAGVRIVIEGDGIPINKKTRNQEFLGVSCHSILFENGYPILYCNGKEYDCDLFDPKSRNWQTVYFNGLEKTEGYIYDSERKLSFLGTAGDDNIYFIGLNLTYHYGLTKDENVREILHGITENCLRELPDRKVVPLKIKHAKHQITIQSDRNNVNTALAYQDIFEESHGIYKKQHLTYVNEGVTNIVINYPYLKEGMIFSMIGVLLTAGFLFWIRRDEKQMQEMDLESEET
ncbi:MAG: hypothetical protein HFI75_05135 [Lachnospiraceae bacterium]|nr:hypothetical protein [Lachnospiraceae bacterium]